jgi:hypothetical protein
MISASGGLRFARDDANRAKYGHRETAYSRFFERKPLKTKYRREINSAGFKLP